jgi:hypothetical protein
MGRALTANRIKAKGVAKRKPEASKATAAPTAGAKRHAKRKQQPRRLFVGHSVFYAGGAVGSHASSARNIVAATAASLTSRLVAAAVAARLVRGSPPGHVQLGDLLTAVPEVERLLNTARLPLIPLVKPSTAKRRRHVITRPAEPAPERPPSPINATSDNESGAE